MVVTLNIADFVEKILIGACNMLAIGLAIAFVIVSTVWFAIGYAIGSGEKREIDFTERRNSNGS